jgi:hypothetical protein
VQKEGLHMILHKIGRIVNGDPDYVDSWLDIAGYATLVADYLTELKKGIEERQLSGNIPQMPTSRIVYADTEF